MTKDDSAFLPSHIDVRSNITVKNAPTSDQLRLLREVEASVKDNLLASFVVNDNAFSGAIALFTDHMNFKLGIRAVFKLNGEQKMAEVIEDVNHKGGELFMKLRNEIALIIANSMVQKFVDTALTENPEFKYAIKNW
jgi:hypothetical protein